MSPILFLSRFRVRLERLWRFAMGYNRDYAPMSPIEFSKRLSETLDKLANIAKGDKIYLVSKVIIELPAQLSEILDRFGRLMIKFKRDIVSVSPILNLLRLR